MRTALIFILISLLSAEVLSAQTAVPNSYWVQLKDKQGTPFMTGQPEAFLSQRAIERRKRQNILIDETDLPVSPVYIDSLKKRGLEIVHASKWLNGTTVRTADTVLIKKIATLPFVSLVQLTKPGNTLKSGANKFADEGNTEVYDPAKYGNAINQLTQLNGQYLHQQGYRGKGIQVAVLDAGFLNVNTIAAFDSLRNSDRILGTRDFVDPKANIYEQNYHGMSVLSCMGGHVPGSLIGSAPDASYYLIRSEDVATEYLIEEDNWVAAAEFADSLGADIINSSLGYSEFNDSKMNHVYADMNGKKTRVTQGANMAFQKGILVFASAGNEGNNSWKRIIAPSDGENVISVGAVDKNGLRASFSSVGPAFGGAVKPNVAATGAGTTLVMGNLTIGNASGTSFSSPVLAGMAACLLQANPYATAKQLKMAIEQSGSQYNMPDSLLGYGIPDFEKADKYLKVNSVVSIDREKAWSVSPNPFAHFLSVRNTATHLNQNVSICIFNLQGICLYQTSFGAGENIILNNLANLPEGILIMRIRSGEKEERIKLLKVAP